MKTFYLLLLVGLVSCLSADPEPVKEVVYTFNVKATDNSKFKAFVTWRVDGGLTYQDPVDSWGYASSFETAPGRVFTITVKSDVANLRLVFSNDRSQVIKDIPIQPNTSYTFDHNLN